MEPKDRIFELADQKYKEQKDFAAALGISESIVSEWRREKSKSWRKEETIRAIAAVLDTTVEYLYTGTPPGQAPYLKITNKGLSDEALAVARAFDRADQRARDMVKLALAPFAENM